MNKGVAVSWEVCTMIKNMKKNKNTFSPGRIRRRFTVKECAEKSFSSVQLRLENVQVIFSYPNMNEIESTMIFCCSLNISKCLLWRTAAHCDISKLRKKKKKKKRWSCLLDFSKFILSHQSNGKSVWNSANPTILLCTESQSLLASPIVSHPFIKASQIN